MSCPLLCLHFVDSSCATVILTSDKLSWWRSRRRCRASTAPQSCLPFDCLLVQSTVPLMMINFDDGGYCCKVLHEGHFRCPLPTPPPCSHPQVSKAFYSWQCPLTCPLLIWLFSLCTSSYSPVELVGTFICRSTVAPAVVVQVASLAAEWESSSRESCQRREQGASAHLPNRFHQSLHCVLFLRWSFDGVFHFVQSCLLPII